MRGKNWWGGGGGQRETNRQRKLTDDTNNYTHRRKNIIISLNELTDRASIFAYVVQIHGEKADFWHIHFPSTAENLQTSKQNFRQKKKEWNKN